MDPFESDLLCSSNVSNGKNASSKDEASLIDQDRWQRFAVWQYSQYLQRDRNLAERWADMNKLDTKMRRSLKRRRLAQPSAPPHTAAHPCPEADAPKHVRLGQKPLDAKPSTPEIEAKSYQRHRRLLGRNMPLVSPIDQADLSRSGPDPEVAHNSTRSPVTVPKSTNRPLSSSSKLFQPHESSGSSGDEEQQISALRSHLSMKARHVMHSKTVTGPSRDAGSGGKAVNLGTRSSRREKLIKPIPMPSGRTLYQKFPDTAAYIDFLLKNKIALFTEYLRPANIRLTKKNLDDKAADEISATEEGPLDPDVTGLFAGVRTLILAHTRSLMDLGNGHIHLQNLAKRGAQIVGFASADDDNPPRFSLGEVTHIICFGAPHTWSAPQVVRLTGACEEDVLNGGLKVVSADWISHSVREGCLASVALDEIVLAQCPNQPDVKEADPSTSRRHIKVPISERQWSPQPPVYDDNSYASSSSLSHREKSYPLTSTPAAGPSKSDSAAQSAVVPRLSISGSTEAVKDDDLEVLFEEARNISDDDEEAPANQQDADMKAYRAARAYPIHLDDPNMILSSTRRDHEHDSFDDSGLARQKMLQRPLTEPEKIPFGFQCEKAHTKGEVKSGPNEDICEKLDELKTFYETRNDPGNIWRVYGLRRAIGVLRNCTERIDTYDKAIRFSSIGDPTARKIAEIASTGDLRRVGMMQTQEDRWTEIFLKVYGAGRQIAREWVNKGARQLSDLKEGNPFGIVLNRAQTLGLRHYTDLQERIPRLEVKEIGSFIQSTGSAIDCQVEIHLMGSYRRGQLDCGDIDVIITRSTQDGKTHAGFLKKLCLALKQQGLLIDDLSIPHDWYALDAKYMGLCALPGGIVRHIDILAVPEDERGAALIYFTGNDVFNRSLRLKARRQGCTLNQRGLYRNTARDQSTGNKVTEGIKIAGRTEQEIFDALNVVWRPPHQRQP